MSTSMYLYQREVSVAWTPMLAPLLKAHQFRNLKTDDSSHQPFGCHLQYRASSFQLDYIMAKEPARTCILEEREHWHFRIHPHPSGSMMTSKDNR